MENCDSGERTLPKTALFPPLGEIADNCRIEAGLTPINRNQDTAMQPILFQSSACQRQSFTFTHRYILIIHSTQGLPDTGMAPSPGRAGGGDGGWWWCHLQHVIILGWLSPGGLLRGGVTQVFRKLKHFYVLTSAQVLQNQSSSSSVICCLDESVRMAHFHLPCFKAV